MRILLLCEGPNEETIMNILLDNNCLKFKRADLIGLRPYPRILKAQMIQRELKMYGEPVIVYRIGDTLLKEDLDIPNELKGIILKKNISLYCTKPEIEMLLILNEGLERDFEKVKSSTKAKTFAKQHIIYNGKRYDQSSQFFIDYFSGKNIKRLVNSIKKYKSYKKHRSRKELYLADLLK